MSVKMEFISMLLQLVMRMRHSQRKHYRLNTAESKKEARDLERRVDGMCAELLKMKQDELFPYAAEDTYDPQSSGVTGY